MLKTPDQALTLLGQPIRRRLESEETMSDEEQMVIDEEGDDDVIGKYTQLIKVSCLCNLNNIYKGQKIHLCVVELLASFAVNIFSLFRTQS